MRLPILEHKSPLVALGHQRTISFFPLGSHPIASTQHLLCKEILPDSDPHKQLSQSITTGKFNKDELKGLLNKVDPNFREALEDTFLMMAVRSAIEESSKDQKNKGLIATVRGKLGSQKKDVSKIVSELLNNKRTDPTLCNINGETAISIAYEIQDKENYELLINAINHWRMTYKLKLEEIKDQTLLLSIQTKFSEEPSYYLHHCVSHNDSKNIHTLWQWLVSGSTSTSREIKEAKANFNPNIIIKSETALTLAANEGYLEVVTALLRFPEVCIGVKNDFGMTAVMAATAAKQFHCLEAMLESLKNNSEMLQFALTTKDNEGDDGQTPLMKAAALNDVKSIELLLEHQKCLDLKTRAALIQYAIMQAIKSNSKNTLASLLKAHVELFPRESRSQLLPAGILKTAIENSTASTILALLNHEILEIPEDVIDFLIARKKAAKARTDLQIEDKDLAEIIRRLLTITAPPAQRVGDKILEQLIKLMRAEVLLTFLLTKIRQSDKEVADSILFNENESILIKMTDESLALNWFIGEFIKLVFEQEGDPEKLALWISDPLLPLPRSSIDLLSTRQNGKTQIIHRGKFSVILCSILAKRGGPNKGEPLAEIKQIDEIILSTKMDRANVVTNLLGEIEYLVKRTDTKNTDDTKALVGKSSQAKDIETASFLFGSLSNQSALTYYVSTCIKDLTAVTTKMVALVAKNMPNINKILMNEQPTEILKILKNRQVKIPGNAITLLFNRQCSTNPISQKNEADIAVYAKIIYVLLVKLNPPSKENQNEFESNLTALCKRKKLMDCLLQEAQRLYELENSFAVTDGHRYLKAESILENAIDLNNALGWYLSCPVKKISKSKEDKETDQAIGEEYLRLYHALELVRNGKSPLTPTSKKSMVYCAITLLQPKKSVHHLHTMQEQATVKLGVS